MNNKAITEYIFIEDYDFKADLAFVFGTRYWKVPAEKVLKLYAANIISKIIFSGGKNKNTGVNEAQTMAEYVIQKGVRREDIFTENKSTNTLENVIFSKEILNNKIGLKNIKSITAVVKNYHSRRALMTLRKHLPNHIILRIYPYSLFNISKKTWHLDEKGKYKVLKEKSKIETYLAKGDLAEI